MKQARNIAIVGPTAGNNLAGRTQEAKFRLTDTGDASYSRKYRSRTHPAGPGLRHRGAYSKKLPCGTHSADKIHEQRSKIRKDEGGESRHPAKTHEQRSKEIKL